jgi:hypothetical protein
MIVTDHSLGYSFGLEDCYALMNQNNDATSQRALDHHSDVKNHHLQSVLDHRLSLLKTRLLLRLH